MNILKEVAFSCFIIARQLTQITVILYLKNLKEKVKSLRLAFAVSRHFTSDLLRRI